MNLDDKIKDMQEQVIKNNSISVVDNEKDEFDKIMHDIMQETDRLNRLRFPLKSKMLMILRHGTYRLVNALKRSKSFVISKVQRMPIIGTLFNTVLSIFGKNKRVTNRRLETLEINIRNNNEIIKNLSDVYRNVDKEIKAHEICIEEYKRLVEEQKEILTDLQSKAVKGNTYYEIDYFDFENHFRGSREHVFEVQKIYLPYFANRKNVLDLGCGRGEFTELLTSHGIGVTGVDLYGPYVDYMKARHLPVVMDDAIKYLRNQDHVDGIFMGQVVEHMPIESVTEICSVAYEKLGEGDYLIMETPNPMCLAIFAESFYMDPSHNRPIHPRTLQYIAQKAGFSEVEILFTNSSKYPLEIPPLNIEAEGIDEFNKVMKRVENILFGSQDYAIIAKK